MDSQESSGSYRSLEIHTFTKMPQCTKCAEFQPEYEYVVMSPAEALKLSCRRCGYVWLMACASDYDLA